MVPMPRSCGPRNTQTRYMVMQEGLTVAVETGIFACARSGIAHRRFQTPRNTAAFSRPATEIPQLPHFSADAAHMTRVIALLVAGLLLGSCSTMPQWMGGMPKGHT
jgi:hypothetical protein